MKQTDYTLYLCTDRGLMSTDTLAEAVEQAILGGCTLIQLREKSCSTLEYYELAREIKMVTDKYHVPLIIDDRVDVALAVDAAGVHVGQTDLPAKEVRRIIGNDKIVGVTAKTVEQAKKAQEDGADYIGVGAMFATSTKTDAIVVTPQRLKEIRACVTIPMVAIGGINENNVEEVNGYGIDGIAVVSAVIAKPDIRLAAEELKRKFRPKSLV